MGSKPKPVDPNTFAYSAAATRQANANADLAAENKREQEMMFGKLFGKDGNSGTLSGFMDPNALNVTGPAGVFKQQYNQSRGILAKQMSNQRASLSRDMAARGFGMDSPSGMAADNERKLALGAADASGQLFTDYTGKSYDDALSKFWNATNIASGQAAQARSAAVEGGQGVAQTYANLYGGGMSQIQQKPSMAGSIIGGVGSAAAAFCPCEGVEITMLDGSTRKVEELDKAEHLLGIDGESCVFWSKTAVIASCVEVEFSDGKRTRVSSTHTFALPKGGYKYAARSLGAIVKTLDGEATVTKVSEIGDRLVYPLNIGGSHSYCADGVWALA